MLLDFECPPLLSDFHPCPPTLCLMSLGSGKFIDSCVGAIIPQSGGFCNQFNFEIQNCILKQSKWISGQLNNSSIELKSALQRSRVQVNNSQLVQIPSLVTQKPLCSEICDLSKTGRIISTTLCNSKGRIGSNTNAVGVKIPFQYALERDVRSTGSNQNSIELKPKHNQIKPLYSDCYPSPTQVTPSQQRFVTEIRLNIKTPATKSPILSRHEHINARRNRCDAFIYGSPNAYENGEAQFRAIPGKGILHQQSFLSPSPEISQLRLIGKTPQRRSKSKPVNTGVQVEDEYPFNHSIKNSARRREKVSPRKQSIQGDANYYSKLFKHQSNEMPMEQVEVVNFPTYQHLSPFSVRPDSASDVINELLTGNSLANLGHLLRSPDNFVVIDTDEVPQDSSTLALSSPSDSLQPRNDWNFPNFPIEKQPELWNSTLPSSVNSRGIQASTKEITKQFSNVEVQTVSEIPSIQENSELKCNIVVEHSQNPKLETGKRSYLQPPTQSMWSSSTPTEIPNFTYFINQQDVEKTGAKRLYSISRPPKSSTHSIPPPNDQPYIIHSSHYSPITSPITAASIPVTTIVTDVNEMDFNSDPIVFVDGFHNPQPIEGVSNIYKRFHISPGSMRNRQSSNETTVLNKYDNRHNQTFSVSHHHRCHSISPGRGRGDSRSFDCNCTEHIYDQSTKTTQFQRNRCNSPDQQTHLGARADACARSRSASSGSMRSCSCCDCGCQQGSVEAEAEEEAHSAQPSLKQQNKRQQQLPKKVPLEEAPPTHTKSPEKVELREMSIEPPPPPQLVAPSATPVKNSVETQHADAKEDDEKVGKSLNLLSMMGDRHKRELLQRWLVNQVSANVALRVGNQLVHHHAKEAESSRQAVIGGGGKKKPPQLSSKNRRRGGDSDVSSQMTGTSDTSTGSSSEQDGEVTATSRSDSCSQSETETTSVTSSSIVYQRKKHYSKETHKKKKSKHPKNSESEPSDNRKRVIMRRGASSSSRHNKTKAKRTTLRNASKSKSAKIVQIKSEGIKTDRNNAADRSCVVSKPAQVVQLPPKLVAESIKAKRRQPPVSSLEFPKHGLPYQRILELRPQDDLIKSHLNPPDRRIKAVALKNSCFVTVLGPFRQNLSPERQNGILMRYKETFKLVVASSTSERVEKCLSYLKETFPLSAIKCSFKFF